MMITPKIYPANPWKIFLIDGLGAFFSTSLITLFGFNPEWIGLPSRLLFVLGLIAGIFMIYSLSCYLLKPSEWKKFLRPIAIANLGYGGITASLLALYSRNISTLGWLYFIGELIILVILARVELKIAARQMT